MERPQSSSSCRAWTAPGGGRAGSQPNCAFPIPNRNTPARTICWSRNSNQVRCKKDFVWRPTANPPAGRRRMQTPAETDMRRRMQMWKSAHRVKQRGNRSGREDAGRTGRRLGGTERRQGAREKERAPILSHSPYSPFAMLIAGHQGTAVTSRHPPSMVLDHLQDGPQLELRVLQEAHHVLGRGDPRHPPAV